jgi:hypothetical protein
MTSINRGLTNALPWREAVVWMVPILAPLLLILQVLMAPQDADRRQGGRDAYLRLVNDVLLQNDGLLVPGEHGGPPVRATPKLTAGKDLGVFYHDTLLEQDVESRNPGLWHIENGVVLALDGHAHDRPMPFEAPATWKGSLLFRSGGPAESDALSYQGGRIRLLNPITQNSVPVPANAFALPADAAAEHLVLYDGDPTSTEALVRLERVGSVILAHAFVPGWVSVDGETLASKEVAIVRPGSQIRIDDGHRQAWLRFGGAETDAISAWRPLTQRVRDPRLGRFAEAFEAAMGEAMQRHAHVERTNVSTSLDAHLQASLQSALEAYMTPHGPKRAAVTVMDARTGEVLALASWPVSKSESRPILDLNTEDPERNQNFHAMPIGSAAKPLIAAAILAEQPKLATLKVTPGEIPIRQILGVGLESEIKTDHALSKQIDFKTFLQWSSNRYALSLLLLSATRAPEQTGPIQSQPYQIEGRPKDHLPPLLFDHGSGPPTQNCLLQPQCVYLGEMNGGILPWAARLYDYYGVDYESPRRKRPGDVGDDTYDMGVWGDLFSMSEMSATGETRYISALKDISPERQVFPTEDIRSFRDDFVQTILGGEEFPWTTLRLAEAYARLVMNRKVSATLIERQLVPIEREQNKDLAPVLGIASQPWQAIREGMAAVPEGTGKIIEPDRKNLEILAQKRGEVIGLWAKTGTPNLDVLTATPVEAALDDLIHAGKLVMDHDHIAVSTDESLVPVNQAEGRQALLRDLTASQILRRHQVNVDAVLKRAASFDDRTRSGFELKRGKLVLSHHTGKAQHGSEARIFAFVVGRYKGALTADPERALSVAINIQDVWTNSNISAAFAHCVVPSVIAPVLFEDASLWRKPQCN